jgi:hypothetical protein
MNSVDHVLGDLNMHLRLDAGEPYLILPVVLSIMFLLSEPVRGDCREREHVYRRSQKGSRKVVSLLIALKIIFIIVLLELL